MVTAAGRRVGNLKAPHHESLHSVVRQSFHIGTNRNPGRLQTPDGALADILTDDKFHVIILQKCNNSVMSLPVGLHHLGVIDLSILRLVQLEVVRMAEMGPDLTVFLIVCHCDNHVFSSHKSAPELRLCIRIPPGQYFPCFQLQGTSTSLPPM